MRSIRILLPPDIERAEEELGEGVDAGDNFWAVLYYNCKFSYNEDVLAARDGSLSVAFTLEDGRQHNRKLLHVWVQ